MEYIPAKSIVIRTKKSDWFGLDYNMNLYKGCCHGCIYCDSRSDCYRIEGFDRVRAKENALRIVRDELRRKVRTGVVGMGSMSDPYNPFEKELLLTRHALELIEAFGFGTAIATKSDLIVRDADVLAEIREHSPVICKLTITTSDDGLAKKLEPGAPSPSRRFAAIEKLSRRGIYTGVLLMPVLPFLEDGEEQVLDIIRCAHNSGAKFIYAYFGVTLRDNQREWYFDRLAEAFPDENLAERYRRRYRNVYSCLSPKAGRLWKLFREECESSGLLYNMKDIVHSYKKNYEVSQLKLFE